MPIVGMYDGISGFFSSVLKQMETINEILTLGSQLQFWVNVTGAEFQINLPHSVNHSLQ